MTSKVILTDVDDAILDWSTPFTEWALAQGRWTPTTERLQESENIEKWLGCTYEETRELITEFNSHPEIWPNFKALPGAQEAVAKLVEAGYRFVAITACDPEKWSHDNRWDNLQREFPGAFDTLHCVGLSQGKSAHLHRYRPTYWVEDKWSHAVDGADHGHTTFLMDYEHSRGHRDDRITRVTSWEEIAEKVLGTNATVSSLYVLTDEEKKRMDDIHAASLGVQKD